METISVKGIKVMYKDKYKTAHKARAKSIAAPTATIPFPLEIELFISSKLSTTQTLAIEILTAAGIYVFSLYILKALKSQDFELLRQALPKPLAKYLNILESIIVR